MYRSFIITAAIATPLIACAAILPAAKLAICPARVVANWQHRARIDDTSSLPVVACLMRTETGGYRCQRGVGCSRDMGAGQ